MRPPVGIESPAAPISFAVFVSFRRIGADVFLRLASHHSSRLTRLRALAKCARGGVGQFRQEVLSGRVSGAIRPCPFWRFDQISSSVTSAAALRHWFPQQSRLSAKFRRNRQVQRLIPSTTVPLAAAESSNQPCTLGNLPAPEVRSSGPDCEWQSRYPAVPGSRNSRPRLRPTETPRTATVPTTTNSADRMTPASSSHSFFSKFMPQTPSQSNKRAAGLRFVYVECDDCKGKIERLPNVKLDNMRFLEKKPIGQYAS